MKIGTFICWLFGHKFIDWSGDKGDRYITFQVNYCVRCGIDKPNQIKD